MKKRVLIVEDDEPIRESLKDLLEDEGMEVLCAANGKMALENLRTAQELPNLILLDLMMPVMDGYAFRQEQENDPRLAKLPVVVMTADGNIESKKSKIRVQEFLKKPLEIDTILNTVNRYCAQGTRS